MVKQKERLCSEKKTLLIIFIDGFPPWKDPIPSAGSLHKQAAEIIRDEVLTKQCMLSCPQELSISMSSSPTMALQQVGPDQVNYWMTFPTRAASFLEVLDSPDVVRNKGAEISPSGDEVTAKVRKPYTITKQRERWTEEEHQKFLEALKLYGRAWRRIEEHIGTKTAVQIRSHAQKFFSKLEREASIGGSSGTGVSQDIEIPPPRPKRKPSHPYPRKAGGAFSSSPSCDEETKSSLAVCSAFTPLESPADSNVWKEPSRVSPEAHQKMGSPARLRLFGQNVTVPDSGISESDTDQQIGPLDNFIQESDSPRSEVLMEADEMSGITSRRNCEDEARAREKNAFECQPEGALGLTDNESSEGGVCDTNEGSQDAAQKEQKTNQDFSGYLGTNTRGSCFTPWHPSSVVSKQLPASTFTSSAPGFWHGFVPLVPESFVQSSNEDAVATASFALASAWQAMQGSKPNTIGDPKIGMMYSPVTFIAAATQPAFGSASQFFGSAYPLERSANMRPKRAREGNNIVGNQQHNIGNEDEDETTEIRVENEASAMPECSNSTTDVCVPCCSESSNDHIQEDRAEKRLRCLCKNEFHSGKEACRSSLSTYYPLVIDSERSSNLSIPVCTERESEAVQHSSIGIVTSGDCPVLHILTSSGHQEASDQALDNEEKNSSHLIGRYKKSSMEGLLQLEVDDLQNNGDNMKQHTGMHARQNVPLDTEGGGNQIEMCGNDIQQSSDPVQEAVPTPTGPVSRSVVDTKPEERGKSGSLKTEIRVGNVDMVQGGAYVCRADSETCVGEHLFMIKTGGFTLGSRYSGAGFVPYKRPSVVENNTVDELHE